MAIPSRKAGRPIYWCELGREPGDGPQAAVSESAEILAPDWGKIATLSAGARAGECLSHAEQYERRLSDAEPRNPKPHHSGPTRRRAGPFVVLAGSKNGHDRQ